MHVFLKLSETNNSIKEDFKARAYVAVTKTLNILNRNVIRPAVGVDVWCVSD